MQCPDEYTPFTFVRHPASRFLAGVAEVFKTPVVWPQRPRCLQALEAAGMDPERFRLSPRIGEHTPALTRCTLHTVDVPSVHC